MLLVFTTHKISHIHLKNHSVAVAVIGYGEISLIPSHKICSGQNFNFIFLPTVTNFKKLAVKHWKVMQDVDIEVVVRSIHDPAGVYLHQVLTEGGIDVIDAAQEVPQPQEFL